MNHNPKTRSAILITSLLATSFFCHNCKTQAQAINKIYGNKIYLTSKGEGPQVFLDIPSKTVTGGILVNKGDGELEFTEQADDNQGEGRISGLRVSWSGTGLKYEVTPGTFRLLDGQEYSSAGGSVTSPTADATNPRYDIIVVNNTGTLSVITGTPSANPAIPQVNDPATQLALTSVLIAANDLTPTGTSVTTIYDQNTEAYSGISTGVTVNFDNTVNPYNLTKSADVGTWAAGNTIVFTKNSGTATATDYTLLKFYVKLKSAVASTANITVTFMNGTTAVSNARTLTATYGFTKTNTTGYQNISIPMTAFAFTSTTTFNKIKITLAGTGSGFFLDYVQLQGGITTGTITETDPIALGKSVSQFPSYGIRIPEAATQLINANPSHTIGIDTFQISTRKWRDKLADSLGVILGAKLSSNQPITWTASNDITGSATGTTLINPTLTVTGLRGSALPSLATGYLKYNGSAFVFDNTGGGGTPTLTNTQVAFGNASNQITSSPNLVWDNTNTRLGIGTTVPTSSLEVRKDGGGQTATDGLTLSNTSSATAVTQQFPPKLVLLGNGWDGTGSRNVKTAIESRVAAGAPKANLFFTQSINGGAYFDMMQLVSNASNGASLTLPNGSVTAPLGFQIDGNRTYNPNGITTGTGDFLIAPTAHQQIYHPIILLTSTGKFRYNSYSNSNYKYLVNNEMLVSGGVKIDTLPRPIISSLTVQGTPGTTTITYQVVGRLLNGAVTDTSVKMTTTTANATLSPTNKVDITVSTYGASFGNLAEFYFDIYRVATNGAPGSTGKIGTITNAGIPPQQDFELVFSDIGQAGDGTTPSTVNKTGNLVVGGGDALSNGAQVQFNSTTGGTLIQRMTTTQRDAISTPAAGLVVYNTTTNAHQGYNGTLWVDLTGPFKRGPYPTQPTQTLNVIQPSINTLDTFMMGNNNTKYAVFNLLGSATASLQAQTVIGTSNFRANTSLTVGTASGVGSSAVTMVGGQGLGTSPTFYQGSLEHTSTTAASNSITGIDLFLTNQIDASATQTISNYTGAKFQLMTKSSAPTAVPVMDGVVVSTGRWGGGTQSVGTYTAFKADKFAGQTGYITGNYYGFLADSAYTFAAPANSLYGFYNRDNAHKSMRNVFEAETTIGTNTATPSAALAVNSTTQGFLPPRMTTAQRTAISSPAEGLCVYDLDLHKLYVYDGTTWQAAW